MRRDASRSSTDVLPVDATGERRLALATSWRVSGRRVTEAATPLEAIRFLTVHDDVDVSRLRAGGRHE